MVAVAVAEGIMIGAQVDEAFRSNDAYGPALTRRKVYDTTGLYDSCACVLGFFFYG